MINKVFVDLDNTLLPYDTLWPVWKAILTAGFIPRPYKLAFKFGFKSVPKSFMASCFAGTPVGKYNAFFSCLAKKFINDIDPSVKFWAEGLVSKKTQIHILTGSFCSLASGLSDHLGWGVATGTDLEVKSGMLTGKLNTPAIKGEQKVQAIKRVFKLTDNDFKFVAAAGDSYSDRYLLEKCSLRYFPRNTSNRLTKYFAQ